MLDLRPILVVIGILLIILACSWCRPWSPTWRSDIADWQVFLAAGAATLFTGVSLVLMNQGYGDTELTGRQAFLLTSSVWVVVGAFAALPLAFSELELSPAERCSNPCRASRRPVRP